MGDGHEVTGVGAGTGPGVRIDDENRANLACYFIASVLRRNIGNRTPGEVAGLFERGVRVVASRMSAYIYWENDVLIVSPTARGTPGISVEGDLTVLLAVLRGRGFLVPFLKGDLRVGGNLLRALRLLGFLRGRRARTWTGGARHA